MAKSFSQAPRPTSLTPETIAAYERGGPGQDTRARAPTVVGRHEPTDVGNHKPLAEAESESTGRAELTSSEPTNVGKEGPTKTGMGISTKDQKREPTRRLSIDLPESLHRRFKIACAKTDKTMIEEVTDFIKRRTAQLEKE